MEILQQEENQFQLKLINVFFQFFKNALQIIFIGHEAIKMLQVNNNCSFSEVTYITTLYNGGLVLLLFNIISFAYIFYQKHFVRIEFFIAYGLNLFWFVSMLLFSIQQYLQGSCELGQMSLKYFIILSVICQLDVLMIMMFRHEISNRQVNICSNSAVVILTILTPMSMDCAINIISIEIMLVSANLITLLFFTSLNVAIYLFPKLKEQLTNAFKFVCILVLCFLTLNYLLIVYYVQSGDILLNGECIAIDYLTRTYCYLAPITMLGIFPILASFKFSTIDDEDDEGEEMIAAQQVQEQNITNTGFQQSRMALTPHTPYKIIMNSNNVSKQLSQDEQFFFKRT